MHSLGTGAAGGLHVNKSAASEGKRSPARRSYAMRPAGGGRTRPRARDLSEVLCLGLVLGVLNGLGACRLLALVLGEVDAGCHDATNEKCVDDS